MELNHYLAIVRRWWWALVMATLLGGLTAYLISEAVTPTYRSTAMLLVVQQQEEGTVGLADLQASERLANTFSELVTVRPVLVSAIARGGLDISPDDLEERLTVTSPPTTQLLEISADASDPILASDLANLVAETFIATNQSSLAKRPGTVSIVEEAQPSRDPISPNPATNAVLGSLLALIAAGIIVGLAEYLDDTVKNDEVVGQHTGLPVVGYVTRFTRPSKPAEQLRLAMAPHSREAEAFRSIRTNVTFSIGTEGDAKNRILVTSPGPGEGKSTIAANLAVVFGLAGQRVVIVDADLRRPSQHRIFGIPNTSGLTNLLAASGVNLNEAIHRTAYDRVWLLPSGPLPANPSELLGSGQMGDLLTAVEQHFDIMILDTPPVLAVTDPAVLSRFVSASLVVVDQGRTRTRELRNAVQRLAVAGRPIAGVVINRVSGQQSAHYYAEYRTQQSVAAERLAAQARNRRPARQREAAAPSPKVRLASDVSRRGDTQASVITEAGSDGS